MTFTPDRHHRLHDRLCHGDDQRRAGDADDHLDHPAAITYGTALGATQLDATASVAGTFAYTPASGTVLEAGNADAVRDLHADRHHRLHRRQWHDDDHRRCRRRRRSPGPSPAADHLRHGTRDPPSSTRRRRWRARSPTRRPRARCCMRARTKCCPCCSRPPTQSTTSETRPARQSMSRRLL